MEQFIIKLEWEPSFNKLTNEQRGILFQVFFDYHNQRELDFQGDLMVEVLWLNMVNNIERINNKYLASVENGKKGGRPKKTQVKPNNNLKKPNNNLTEPNQKDPITLKEKEKEKENNNASATSNASAKIKTINADYSWKQQDYLRYLRNGYTITYGDIVISSEKDVEEAFKEINIFDFNI